MTYPDGAVPDCFYTDGGVMIANPSDVGGAWAFRGLLGGSEGKVVAWGSGLVIAKPGQTISNNRTEYQAIATALISVPKGWRGVIYTDSQIASQWMRGMGNPGAFIPDWLLAMGQEGMAKAGRVDFVLLKGHPSDQDLERGQRGGRPVSIHNRWADEECTRVMRAYIAGELTYDIDQETTQPAAAD